MNDMPHALYCKQADINLPYMPLWHDRDWHEFHKLFSDKDLTLVMNHIKKRYSTNRTIMRHMLGFRFLIQQPDRFSELLAEAKAVPRKHTDRQSVLAATGRATEPKSKPALSIGDVLRSMKEL